HCLSLRLAGSDTGSKVYCGGMAIEMPLSREERGNSVFAIFMVYNPCSDPVATLWACGGQPMIRSATWSSSVVADCCKVQQRQPGLSVNISALTSVNIIPGNERSFFHNSSIHKFFFIKHLRQE